MKTVLITGAAGFIGSHIVEDLIEDNKIIAICSMRESGNLKRLEHLKDHPNLKVIYHDLACEFSSQLIAQIGNVEYIVHAAAQPHVDKSVKDPRGTVQSNVIGTLNILEFARLQSDLKHFIYFSTDEVFGPAVGDIVHHEYSAFNPTNPYSASKAAGEDLATAYYYSYKLPISISHSMNVFGERQQAAAFIPIVINKALTGETLNIHTDAAGKVPSRNYLYVKDVSRATTLLLFKKFERIVLVPKYNIGQPLSYRIDNIATKISEALNLPLIVNFTQTERAFVDTKYSLSTDRLTRLGWKADNGPLFWKHLDSVVKWYKDNPEWF
jgi:dTDP-glucose 4,6-dehydratase